MVARRESESARGIEIDQNMVRSYSVTLPLAILIPARAWWFVHSEEQVRG